MEERLEFSTGDLIKIKVEYIVRIFTQLDDQVEVIRKIERIANLLGSDYLFGIIQRVISKDTNKIKITIPEHLFVPIMEISNNRLLKYSFSTNSLQFIVSSTNIFFKEVKIIKKKYTKAMYNGKVCKVERTIICNKTYYKIITTDTNEVVNTVFKRDKRLKLINK